MYVCHSLWDSTHHLASMALITYDDRASWCEKTKNMLWCRLRSTFDLLSRCHKSQCAMQFVTFFRVCRARTFIVAHTKSGSKTKLRRIWCAYTITFPVRWNVHSIPRARCRNHVVLEVDLVTKDTNPHLERKVQSEYIDAGKSIVALGVLGHDFRSVMMIQLTSSRCVKMILPQVHLRKPCYDFSFL